MRALITIALLAATLANTQATISHRLSAQNGVLRIEVDDKPGVSLVGVHYSLNSMLSGVKAGRWNYDIRSKNGGKWVHENSLTGVKAGDTVYYWIYVLVNGHGEQITDQKWTAPASAGSGRPTNPTNPTNPVNKPSIPVVQPSTGGDQVWKGRKLRLILDDNFDSSLDLTKWEHEVTLSGGGNWEFQAYTPLAQNSFVKNGALFIKPTLTADKYGESFLTSGTWDMQQYYGKCTDGNFWGCKRNGRDGFLNPAMSAKLKSKQNIRYGKVEIVAKMPRGDWLWPALWMLPDGYGKGGSGAYGGWPRSGEIDIMESRGNRQYGNLGVEYMGSTLHWGSDPGNNRYGMTTSHKKARTGTLADGYHTYTFYWDESEMVFQLDGDHVATFKTPNQGFFRWANLPGTNIWAHANNAPFDKPFYLILNVAVGGTNGFFPDSVPNGSGTKPWKNTDGNGPQKFWQGKSQWYPTWHGDDAAMQIDSVRMWQLE